MMFDLYPSDHEFESIPLMNHFFFRCSSSGKEEYTHVQWKRVVLCAASSLPALFGLPFGVTRAAEEAEGFHFLFTFHLKQSS